MAHDLFSGATNSKDILTPYALKKTKKNPSLCMDIADEIEAAMTLEMQLSHCHFNPF